MAERARVVIVGAGFGGLYAAKSLKRAPVDVVVIDKRNYHLFSPLLYQVATAGLDPSEIARPIRRILRHQKNAEVIMAEVVGIDLKKKRVVLSDGEQLYDYLVLATGATHSYFGNDKWAAFAPGLKDIDNALEIRRRLYFAFEEAERQTDKESQRSWMTFVIVGAGPTGVELAGTIAEIANGNLAKDFRRVDPEAARIVLVEVGPRVLQTFPESLSKKAERALTRLGVEVKTSTLVTNIDSLGVNILARKSEATEVSGPKQPIKPSGERISSRTVFWAAGVAASPLGNELHTSLDPKGRVRVRQNLTLEGHDEIYVIGDLALAIQDGHPLPGLAPVAIQEGRYVADDLMRRIRNEKRLGFRYKDRGQLALVGRGAAVAQIGKLELSGFIAWVVWIIIHVLWLIGFRNRALVTFEWAVSYLTYERGARLITGNGVSRPQYSKA